MSSFLTIELDTTSPKIEINTASKVIVGTNSVININSNEALSSFQNIYIIDSSKIVRNYTFAMRSPTELVGAVRFSDYGIGIATIYAQLEDEVGNISELATFEIEVLPSSAVLSLRIKDSIRVGNAKTKMSISNAKIVNRTMKTDSSIDRS